MQHLPQKVRALLRPHRKLARSVPCGHVDTTPWLTRFSLFHGWPPERHNSLLEPELASRTQKARPARFSIHPIAPITNLDTIQSPLEPGNRFLTPPSSAATSPWSSPRDRFSAQLCTSRSSKQTRHLPAHPSPRDVEASRVRAGTAHRRTPVSGRSHRLRSKPLRTGQLPSLLLLLHLGAFNRHSASVTRCGTCNIARHTSASAVALPAAPHASCRIPVLTLLLHL